MKGKYIVKRLLQMVIVLIGISFLTFFLTYLAPGDPATAMYEAAGVTPTEEMLENTRKSMGLDKPFLVQYGVWVGKCLHGDFGESYSKNQPVLKLLIEKLPATLKLALLSLAMMLVISIPLGIYSAVKQNGITDYIIRFLSFGGISLPGFLVGLILMYVFALKLRLVKVSSSTLGFEQMLLPAVTLTIAMASKYTRQVRTAVLDELQSDYVIGARARGMKFNSVLWKHILPNAVLPLITMLGLSFGSLLGGASVVELIFSYPGMGILAVNAVKTRDYPLIQGFVLWIALIYMVVNLVVDISYSYVDPRIREAG
ncbi:MAG: ABC transporter permease [Blautia sp.]|nr:ABC transporter permease [Blautia sp.]